MWYRITTFKSTVIGTYIVCVQFVKTPPTGLQFFGELLHYCVKMLLAKKS